MKIREKIKFEYLVGKASSRKGMGMELALLVLLTVFGCSVLLVSSAMYGKDALVQKEQETLEKIEHLQLEYIAETYLNGGSLKEGTLFADYVVFKKNDESVFETKLNGADLETDPTEGLDANVFLVITDNSGNLLLTVKKEDGITTEWTYY